MLIVNKINILPSDKMKKKYISINKKIDIIHKKRRELNKQEEYLIQSL